MKKIILFVIILSFLIPILTQAETEYTKEQILFSLLDSLDGEFEEGDISINGLIKGEFINDEELDKLGDETVKKLGIVGKQVAGDIDFNGKEYYIKEKISDEGYGQINYFGFDLDKNPLTIIISSYLNESSKKGETYLFINLIKKENFLGNNDIIQLAENLFNEFNQPMEITTCIIGGFDGKFNNTTVENKFDAIISQFNGIIVDKYADDNLISYTAYTDYIDKNIFTGEDKINLNVALRYNEYDDKTLIWIGTPIIANGY